MRTVLEGRKETFEVTLRESSLQDFLVARLINESLHLIDRDVTVLVSVYLFTKVLLERLLRAEVTLQESVDFDKVAFDGLKPVGRHFL